MKRSCAARTRWTGCTESTGLTTEEIGGQLFLSPTTVRNYLSNAIAKVGGRNRIDTIEIARRAGWL